MNAKQLRELDAWIAEHVMGVLKIRHNARIEDHGFGPEIVGGKGKRIWTAGTVENYTTDAEAAMKVLKKCAENTWNVFLRKTSDGMYTVGYIATDKLELAVFAEADTLELAICLFAKELFSKEIPHNEHPTPCNRDHP